ncbi:MAG: hypothetical protein JW987_12125 [Anaerolineaceae bacterium]|nr:hypothetical protein [Anaerolineaceae bacterium]
MSSNLPFPHYPPKHNWYNRGTWPAHWVICHGAEQPPAVAAYRLRFTLTAATRIALYVTADERYELFCDGVRLGRGPERGDPRHWFYETYTLDLSGGEHLLTARVWALGDLAPVAQMSVHPGFLLCPAEERFWDLLATGRAPWEAKLLSGFSFTPPMSAIFVGHKQVLDGTQYGWGFERGEGPGWQSARVLALGATAGANNELPADSHFLLPAALPPRLDEPRWLGTVRNISAPALSETHSIPVRAADHLAEEEPAWAGLLHGANEVTLPPNTRRRVIIDLEDYYCLYPEWVVSGGQGGSLRLQFQESLFANPATWDKGHRGEVEGKFFTMIWRNTDGLGDSFKLNGGEQRRLDTLWWNAGRYVEVLLETSNQPLTIHSVLWHETRYPLEAQSAFQADDQRLDKVFKLGVRALQMCAHETYMDCPFYEQMLYAGDGRLECLVTYALTEDDRLPRKVLQLFDWSRLPEGLTQSRYPSRIRQMIPPFSLWWVAMVSDYLLWRGDPAFVRSLLPGVRAVLDAFTHLREADGLVRSPEGWNYVDWVPAWDSGIPPGGLPGEICGPINWQYVLALRLSAGLETYCGDNELAVRWQRLAVETARALTERYWDEERGLFADDASHTIFTEHSQCLAVLSGLIPAQHQDLISRNLFSAGDLTRPTVYFMHYFFEACRELDRMDVFFERMQAWFEMSELDFKTTYETDPPAGTRSDCHAWGAHPLFHYFSSVLGIRPIAPGFEVVEIAPQLGPLQRAAAQMVHPRGRVDVEAEVTPQGLRVRISLPKGVKGVLRRGEQLIDLVVGYSGEIVLP